MHRYRKQTHGYSGEGRGGINWEIGIDMYTLHIHLIRTYGIAQELDSSSIMAPGEKNLKTGVDVCARDSLCCTSETNTTL